VVRRRSSPPAEQVLPAAVAATLHVHQHPCRTYNKKENKILFIFAYPELFFENCCCFI
jgi:hypothetical protein